MITASKEGVGAVIKMVFEENEIKKLGGLSINHPHPHVRRKSLALLLKSCKDHKHYEIAKTIGVCENTLRSYFKQYKSEGITALTTVNFRKPTGKLVPFAQVVMDYIKETPPATIKQACKEIGDLTGAELKETQMRTYLKSFGVKFLKVCAIPARANPEEQEKFLESELKPRLKEAEEGKRTVYFIDSAHFVLGAFLGCLWALTRIFVRTPSGRQRFNVLGALNAITKELIMVTNDTYITSTQVCEMLAMLAKKSAIPITIVLDNARYQRCQLVIEFAKTLNIELLFLPTYSPNLNLIERIWKFTKKKCLNSKYYGSFAPFKAVISDFLATMNSKHKAEVNSLLTLNFQLFTKDQFTNAI